MSLKSTLLAASVAGASLLAAASTASASGHGCTVAGGAAGCSAAQAIANGTALTANDVAGTTNDFTFAGGTASLRCTRAVGAGTLASNGGATFPVGGAGPSGYLSSLTLDNGSAASRCTGSIAGVAVTGTVLVNDTNTGAGLVNVLGDWNAGAPRLTLQNLSVTATLYSGSSVFATCTLGAAAYSGAVANNAAGLVNFSGTLTKTAGSAVCPASGTASVPVNLVTPTGAAYVTA